MYTNTHTHLALESTTAISYITMYKAAKLSRGYEGCKWQLSILLVPLLATSNCNCKVTKPEKKQTIAAPLGVFFLPLPPALR